VGFEPTRKLRPLAVFKSVRDSLPGSGATWAFSSRPHHVTQDHPVYTPRDLYCSIRHMADTNLLIGRYLSGRGPGSASRSVLVVLFGFDPLIVR